MKSVTFQIGDDEDRLSIAHALAQGYRVTLTHEDGEAEIVKPGGVTYHVRNFGCDCPDALRRRGGTYGGHCKHAVWVSQLRPCDLCGQTMGMVEVRDCFGHTSRRFECGVCGHAKALDAVRQERRAYRHGQAVTA